MIKKLITLFCFFPTFISLNQKQVDSLIIVKHFENALTNASPEGNPLDEVKQLFLKKKADKHFVDTYYIQWSRYLLLTGQVDSSILISKLGVKNAQEIDDISKAKFMNLLGSAHSLKHNYKEAIAYFEKSLKLMEKNNEEESIAYVHNNIANLFFSLLDYDSAYKHAIEAYKIIRSYPKDPNYSSIMSILSVAEAKLKKFSDAENHGLEAVKIAQKQNNIVAQIIGNHTLGDVYLNKNQLNLSEQHFALSLEMSQKYQQDHFSMLNFIGLMNVSIQLKEFNKAVDYGEKGLQLSITLNNADTHYSLLKGLSKGHAGLKNYEKGYELLLQSHEAFLKSNSVETQREISDILIKYDSEKKERDLSEMKLNLLKKEVQTARYIVAVLILITALIIILVVLLIIKQRNKQKMFLLNEEKQKQVLNALMSGEENERKRIAIDLHDGIASDLTAIRYQIDNLETKENSFKQDLIQSLIIVQEEARRIAHNLSPLIIVEQGLNQAIANHIKSNNNSKCKLEFISNLPDNYKIKAELSVLIYRMIQELIHNALKHAEASNIIVQILLVGNELNITIEDDGIGFNVKECMKSNGLMGITKRVQILKGSLNIDSSNDGNGAIVQIVLQPN